MAEGFSGLGAAGGILGIAGALTSSIGSFYAAKASQYELAGRAQDLRFQASVANINARQAELEAQFILQAGQRERALRSLQFGQVAGQARASQAAAGIQAGVGSAAEVLTSIEFAKEADVFALDAKAVRAAQSARLRGVDLQNQALLARTSAANLNRLRRSINPVLAGVTSLLGSAPQVASSFLAFSNRGGS